MEIENVDVFKKMNNKKLKKYTSKLRGKFWSYEIKELVNIYKKIMRLSNIFILNVVMFIVSMIMIILTQTSNMSFFVKSKEAILSIFSVASIALIIISTVFTVFLIFYVLRSKIKEVRKHVFIWIVISLFPIPLISTVTMFIAKWKIGRIYKYR